MTDKIYQPTIAGLRAFVAVAERRQFSSAATALGVTQSTLSQALAALGARRAFAAMIGTALAFVAVSVALFGPGLWWDWANVYLHPQHEMAMNATDWGHMWDASVSTCASLLGAPGWLAKGLQGAAALAGAAVVWRAFRTVLAPAARLAILLCAALLVSPHVSPYDLIFLALAGLVLAMG